VRGGAAGRHPADSQAQRSAPSKPGKPTLTEIMSNLLFGPVRKPSDNTMEAPGRKGGTKPAGKTGPGKQSYWWGIKDNGEGQGK
jgi:hypothetical protein